MYGIHIAFTITYVVNSDIKIYVYITIIVYLMISIKLVVPELYTLKLWVGFFSHWSSKVQISQKLLYQHNFLPAFHYSAYNWH